MLTQPFGSGATVVYKLCRSADQQSDPDTYQLQLSMDDKYLYGSWYSSAHTCANYEVYESGHYIRSQWWGGYTRSNVLRRKITDQEGSLVGDELVCANEAIMMYEPLLAEANNP